MKKEECCSVFMTTLMIAVPVGSVIALLIEIFGINGIYKVFTDLGSFIAGIIGFSGVIWLVLNQNKETKKILDSNMVLMRSEVLESQKIKATEHAASIGDKLSQLRRCSPAEFHNWVNDPSFGRYFFKEVKLFSYRLDAFIQNNGNSLELITCKECIDNFIDLYEQPGFIGSYNHSYRPHQFSLLLGSLMNLYLIDGVAKQKGQFVIYTDWQTGNVLIHDPNDLYIRFSSFNIFDISGFIIQQMVSVVMPTLIHEINRIEVSVK